MKKLCIILGIILSISCLGQDKHNKKDAKLDVELHYLINSWHKAAAQGNMDGFFNKMTKDAIYIGTDASEKWKFDEFKVFCKEYFADGMGWDFKPIKREIYYNKRKDVAWFDEQLDTWMGVCMSSGVLVKTKKYGWRIKHYQLSIAVPNDVVDDFIKLVKTNNKR